MIYFYAACFFSGAAALFYQVLWARAFALVFGSTMYAGAAVLSCFLLGMAVGAFVVGRRADKLRAPFKTYGLVEAAIALSGVGIGLFVHQSTLALTGVYTLLGGSIPSAFLLAFALMILPTALMGAALPLVYAGLARVKFSSRRVAGLYGGNIMGAAAGCLAVGFYVLPTFGVSVSYYWAGLLNILAAAAIAAAAYSCKVFPLGQPLQPQRASQVLPPLYLLATAFVSGVAVMGMEVVWIRYAAFFMGNRTYAFSLLLFNVLFILGIAAWLAPYCLRRFGHRSVLVVGIAAVWLGVLGTLAGRWWVLNQHVYELDLPGFEQWLLMYRLLEGFVLMFPVFLPLGLLFPLTLMQAQRHEVGIRSGELYLVNGLGAVTGALITSFGVVWWLGTVAAGFMLAGLVALWLLCVVPRKRIVLLAVMPMLPLVVLAPRSLVPWNEIVLYEHEDAYGVFKVIVEPERHNAIRAYINKLDLVYALGGGWTVATHGMIGHLGMVFNPQAQRALVIGSGYGITSGLLGRYPHIQLVDTVEILPAAVTSAPLYTFGTWAYHKNPKVKIHIQDGRYFLSNARQSYDIIVVTPSNPAVPHGSGLYHQEFYQLAAQKLTPGGVLVTHMFGQHIPTILRTLHTVFPHIKLHRTYSEGFAVVASQMPLNLDENVLKRMLAEPAVEQLIIQSEGRTDGVDTFLQDINTLEGIERAKDLMRKGQIATDDYPVMEFYMQQDNPANILFSDE